MCFCMIPCFFCNDMERKEYLMCHNDEAADNTYIDLR